jgi:Ca2+-binding RTX toxin-like protein
MQLVKEFGRDCRSSRKRRLTEFGPNILGRLFDRSLNTKDTAMPATFIHAGRRGRRSPTRIAHNRLLRFEALEPRQLLAVDAVDDVLTVNGFRTVQFLDPRQNDVFPSPSSPEIILSVSPTALGARVEVVSSQFNRGIGIHYYPTGVYGVQDTFTYTVTDGTPGGEDTATVTVELVDGYFEESVLGSQLAVPGELVTRIYRIHDVPSASGVSPTFSSTLLWADGVVTPVYVSHTVLPNGDVEAFLSYWRTFYAPGSYDKTWTISKSDGTQKVYQSGVGVVSIVQRIDPNGQTELAIGGIDGFSDRILIEPAASGNKYVPPGIYVIANEPAMRVYYDGSDMGAFVADRLVVYGQGGNDLIQVNAAITFNAQLFGQAGNDILVGGSGNDILVGGIGDDILYGFNGRDLLFGGLGRDFLQGASWNGSATTADGDLLIGSYVSFDNDVILLNQLAAQWQTDDPYSTRIATIRASSPRLRMNETVFDDWSLDYVFGAGDLDWFWVEPTRDNFDAQADETVN